MPERSLRPIRALPDDLINQIAAGEVIERPASIVKELLENSLDASASAIKIEIDGGGIDRIAVSDDGNGIPARELHLALQRHCTSKVADYADLAGITSLGFRGEALASISAVADMSLVSRTRDESHAWMVTSTPRQGINPIRPSSGNVGTTITIRELFATVPVRRQFLRRAQTELFHIQQLLRALAFCSPAVALSLVTEQRRHWQAPATRDDYSARQRWRAVFGAEFADNARYVDINADGIRVYGWIGLPDLARSQIDLQYLAVNGRLIRDRQLAHGIRIAFEDSILDGRHPTYALHIELPPTEVDVNVHPMKSEVRFRQLRVVHDLIHSATRQALQQPARVIREQASWQVRELAPSRTAFSSPSITTTVTEIASRPIPPADLIGARYVLCQSSNGEWVVWDLVRWCELLLLANGERSKLLLIPTRIPHDDVLTRLQTLASLGFNTAEVAPGRWVLRGTPQHLPLFDTASFLPHLQSKTDDALSPAAVAAAAWARVVSIASEPHARRKLFDEWDALASDLGIDARQYRRPLTVNILAALF